MIAQKLDLSPKALVATLIGTLVVLVAGTWFILVAPKHSQASSLDSQIQNAQTQLAVRKHTAEKAKSAAAQAIRVRRALPDSVAMPQVLLELNRVANEEHVSLDTVTPATPTPFSGFEEVPITVVVSGKFFAVEGFLHELRNQVHTTSNGVFATGRLFDVQSVNLAQSSTTTPGVSATLDMSAFVYSGLPLASPTTTVSG